MRATLIYKLRRWWFEIVQGKEYIGCCVICFKPTTIEDLEYEHAHGHKHSKLVALFLWRPQHSITRSGGAQ